MKKAETFNSLTNTQKSELYRKNYNQWRKEGFRKKYGYFIIFEGFIENNILQKLSGNAVRLYIYFGLNSRNNTGESFHSLDTIAKYFQCSKRSVQNWINELEKANLIIRGQLEYNGVSHTFLQPYRHSIYSPK